MMSLPAIRNLFLAPAFVAALLAAAAAKGQVVPSVPLPPPPPPTDPSGPKANGAILVNDRTCGVAPEAGDLCAQDFADKISDFRTADFGLPKLKTSFNIGGVAHEHVLDMIQQQYIAIPASNGMGLKQQLATGSDDGVLCFNQSFGPVSNVGSTKTIIMVGCFGGNTTLEIWNAIKNDPHLSAVAKGDWDRIGADIHHRDDGIAASRGARRNYIQIIFVKDAVPSGGQN